MNGFNRQNFSKSLGQNDDSGFYFSKEMLAGDPTYAINFDRLQYHPSYGYIIFEYLLCEATQTVTPHSSHPNRYFNKNKHKFISLHRVQIDLKATLYLVNYAKEGTHFDKVRLMKVISVNESNKTSPVITEDYNITRNEFKIWFRKLNNECGMY